MSIAPKHTSFAQLIDLIEGRLSLADRAQAQAHTAGCAPCAAELARLTRITDLMRTDTCEDAPSQAIAQATALFRMRRVPASPTLRQRLLAVLRFDSGHTLQPIGVRAGAQTERQLLFNAGDIDLDVQIAQDGELWKIAGQLLGTDIRGQVDLQGAGGAAQATLNELGEFRLPAVPAGIYTLTLQLEAADIEVIGLGVGV